jgi:hypothetical protein
LKIKKQNPESDVEVWSMDEHLIGLKPVREENGWMSLVMLLPLLIGGFNGCGYTVLYIRVREKPKEWILPFVNIQLFDRVLADFALQ